MVTEKWGFYWHQNLIKFEKKMCENWAIFLHDIEKPNILLYENVSKFPELVRIAWKYENGERFLFW